MDEFEPVEEINKAEEKKKEEKKTFRKGFVAGLSISLAIVLVFSLLFIILFQTSSKNLLSKATKNKLAVIESLMDKYYYKDIDVSNLQEGLYKGVVEGLGDKYSEYYTKDETQAMTEQLTGKYVGVGAALSQDKDTKEVSVVYVYDDSPMSDAGVTMGDIIDSVDGNIVTNMELSDVVSKLRGTEGTDVDIVYEHNGEQKNATLTRRSINMPSVSYQMLDNGVGYIRIMEFSEGTDDEFNTALADLQKQGMTSVVFDLRDNPGGLVDSVTKMLDTILPKGTVVYMKDKDGKRTNYTSDEDTKLTCPIAVLVNENSASAAEIFAGAIRDFHYGTLIGTTTYGKGVVQSTIPLNDGSMLKVTTAEYFTPSGENITGVGITPDIEMDYSYSGNADAKDYDYSKDNQVQKAVEIVTQNQ